jgi:hypothetical protein
MGKKLIIWVLFSLMVFLIPIINAEWTADLNTDLNLYYKLDETSGTNAEDSLGNSNGTVTATPTTWTSGIINNGLLVNKTEGLGSGVTYLNSSNDWSVAFWFKPTDDATNEAIFGFNQSDINNRFYVTRYTDDKLKIYATVGSVEKWAGSGIDVIANDNWQFFVLNYFSATNNVTIWINDTVQISIDSDVDPITITEMGFGTMAYPGQEDRTLIGVMDEIGQWNRTLTNAEITQLYNGGAGITYTAPDIIAPVITFLNQTPLIFTSDNLYITKLRVNYSITDISGVDKVYYYSKTNSSTSETWQFINGTETTSGYIGLNDRVGVEITNISSTWNFLTSSTLIYPSTFNLDPEVTGLESHNFSILDNQNEYLKIRVLNMTNNSYGTFNFMANSSVGADDLKIYFCNSSYTTGSLSTDDSCGIFANYPATQTFNYSVSDNAKYNFVPFSMNVTSSSIAGVAVTDINYFALRGTNAGEWHIYYVTNISRSDTIRSSGNGGSSWTNFAGTIDAFVSQYSPLNYTNYYYVCANDTLGNYGCSSVRSNAITEVGLPPTIPSVYSPIAQVYSRNININYTNSESASGMSYYNISLGYSNQTYLSTINTNNSLDLSYIWSSVGTSDGNYTIRVEAVGDDNLTSFGYSEEFEIDNTLPSVSIVYPANTSYLFDFEPTTLNYTYTESNPSRCWYSLNNGVTNSTTQTCGTNWTGLNSAVGSHTWTIYMNDTTGNENSTSVTFYYTALPLASIGGGTGGYIDTSKELGSLIVDAPSIVQYGETFKINFQVFDDNYNPYDPNTYGINLPLHQNLTIESGKIKRITVGEYEQTFKITPKIDTTDDFELNFVVYAKGYEVLKEEEVEIDLVYQKTSFAVQTFKKYWYLIGLCGLILYFGVLDVAKKGRRKRPILYNNRRK